MKPANNITGQQVSGFEILKNLGENRDTYLAVAEKFTKQYAVIRHISLPDKERYFNILEQLNYNRMMTEAYFYRAAADMASKVDTLIELSGQRNNRLVRYYNYDIKKEDDPLRFDILIRMECLIALSKHIRTNGMRLKDILQLGIDICQALETCHSKGILHQNIKESKIFVDKDNSFRLGGFEIGKSLDEPEAMAFSTTSEARQGVVFDELEDIYSLGIVMYKLLNNQRMPFMPASGAFYPDDAALAEEKRLSGRELPLHGGEGIGGIILKACAARDMRYKDAAEFKDELLACLSSLPYEQGNELIITPHPKVPMALEHTGMTAKKHVPQRTLRGEGGSKAHTRRTARRPKFMALFIPALLITLSICVLAACLPRQNPAAMFMDAVEAGSFEAAREIYIEMLSGNPEESGKAARFLEEYAGVLTEDYRMNKLQYEYTVSVLQTIGDMSIADMEPYMQAIAASGGGEAHETPGPTPSAAPTPTAVLPEAVTPSATPKPAPAPTRVPSYLLTFETNGGEPVEAVRLNSDTIVKGSQFVTVREGYKFRAWYMDSALTEEFISGSLSGNMVLYAGWDITHYKVTFDYGDGNPEVRLVAFNEPVSAPPSRAKDGLPAESWEIFWRLNDVVYKMGNTTDKDITLTASWRRLVWLSFETGGAEQINKIKISYSTIPEDYIPANPSKQGYVFDGWYEDSAFTKPFNPKEILLENKTLYAKWK